MFTPSVPCPLDLVTQLLQRGHELFDMAAVHLDHPVLNSATGTTSGFELLAQLLQLV